MLSRIFFKFFDRTLCAQTCTFYNKIIGETLNFVGEVFIQLHLVLDKHFQAKNKVFLTH